MKQVSNRDDRRAEIDDQAAQRFNQLMRAFAKSRTRKAARLLHDEERKLQRVTPSAPARRSARSQAAD